MTGILLVGVGLFAVVLITQALLWRYCTIRKEMLWLLVLFLLVPSLLHALILYVGAWGPLDVAMVYMLFVALACAYIQTYPALREEIPSFRILLAIAAAGLQGMSEDEVVREVRAGNLFAQKIDDLAKDRLIEIGPDGSLVLLPAGRTLARVFNWYRCLLGTGHGDG